MRTKIITLTMLLVLVLLSACASAGQPGISPTATLPDTPAPTAGVKLPENAQQILSGALAHIAESLGIAASDITIKSMEEAMWRDSCLGVSQPNVMCAQVITPGFLIILDTPQGEVEVHTNKTGDNFRVIPPKGSDPTAPAIVFERSGGIAGICFNLTIDYKGGYVYQDCKTNASPVTGNLQPAEVATLTGFLDKIGSFQYESNNPAGSADMFNDLLIFNGKGSGPADEAVQQEILAFLSTLANQISKSGPTSNTLDSGIEGQVLIGPACPGPARDTPCPDKPYQAAFSVMSLANEQVAQFISDSQGHFRISLKPGVYYVHPEVEGRYPIAEDQEVLVTAGDYTSIEIWFDSGMR